MCRQAFLGRKRTLPNPFFADAAVRRTGARKLADLQSRDILPHTGFVYYDPSGGDDKLDEIREALIDAGIMREEDI